LFALRVLTFVLDWDPLDLARVLLARHVRAALDVRYERNPGRIVRTLSKRHRVHRVRELLVDVEVLEHLNAAIHGFWHVIDLLRGAVEVPRFGDRNAIGTRCAGPFGHEWGTRESKADPSDRSK
jgi:hypothetical protein